MSWQTVLGFEIHIELSTKSKMFCGCSADHFGKSANTQVCPVCLGLPGALPVPNLKAIEGCIKLGLALNCQINLHSKFDRKNYFYPDLPKGYQISQYDQPFCFEGYLTLTSGKKIRVRRVHMEEDTGKLQHQGGEPLIDFNRSGVPLVEVVTEADFADSTESDEFLKEIQAIVRALGISTADMEKGSMRLEANISLRPEGTTEMPNFKSEVKNVNSFRFIKKAIEFEIKRQTALLDRGEIPLQETRGWSEAKGETVSQRSKEEAHDYRYFPEPDIPPFEFTPEQIEKWRSELPELPAFKIKQLIDKGIPSDMAITLVMSSVRLNKFNDLIKEHDPLLVAKTLVNTPENKVVDLVITPKQIVVDVEKIRSVSQEVIITNSKAVEDIKNGKEQVMFFLIGQIKKKLGDVDVKTAQRILSELISST
jgi:aspartyl-tRNA(Asn)/glutamyl-tRNA(Gln) amidotransferase subunit B